MVYGDLREIVVVCLLVMYRLCETVTVSVTQSHSLSR